MPAFSGNLSRVADAGASKVFRAMNNELDRRRVIMTGAGIAAAAGAGAGSAAAADTPTGRASPLLYR